MHNTKRCTIFNVKYYDQNTQEAGEEEKSSSSSGE